MNISILKKFAFILCSLIGLCLLGLGFSALENKLGLSDEESQINEGNASFLFAVLGGYGNVVSDFVWIRSYIYWEQEDLENCVADMDLALAINPKVKSHWIVAYTTIAYDVPHWLAGEEGLGKLDYFRKQQAKKAIVYLDKALEYFPKDIDLLRQKAHLCTITQDYKTAVACYEEIDKADVVYIGRGYADMLFLDKQYAKAISILEALLVNLNPNAPIYEAITRDIAIIKSVAEQ